MLSNNRPSGSWDDQLRYWVEQLSITQSKLRMLDSELLETSDRIETEKLLNEIDACKLEIQQIQVNIQVAEAGRKQTLKTQMEKEAQR